MVIEELQQIRRELSAIVPRLHSLAKGDARIRMIADAVNVVEEDLKMIVKNRMPRS